MKAIRADAGFARLYLEFLAHSRDLAVQERVRASYRRTHGLAGGIFASLRERGLVSATVAPAAFAVAWTALLDGLALIALIDPEAVDPATLSPSVAEILWGGIAPRASRGPQGR